MTELRQERYHLPLNQYSMSVHIKENLCSKNQWSPFRFNLSPTRLSQLDSLKNKIVLTQGEGQESLSESRHQMLGIYSNEWNMVG